MAPSTEPSSRAARREQRATRILDAAGELLVAWGYPKITIEDIARRAGVGKGTVYLHFPTKEVLFLAVVLRAQTALAERIQNVMRQGPSGIWPSELARTIYLGQHESPVMNAVITGRTETLGALTRAAAENSQDLVDERIRVMESYFDLLRENRLTRTDRSRDEQLYTLFTIVSGFLSAEPVMAAQPAFPSPDAATRADLLADTVRATLGESDASGTLHAVWPKVTALYEGMFRRAQAEVDHYTQSQRDT